MSDRDFIRRLHEKYRDPTETAKPAARLAPTRESASQWPEPGRAECSVQHVAGNGSAAGLLDRFLADSSIPLAVLRSRALGRDFVVARDSTALETLAENGRHLPVLTFADCEKLRGLGVRELAAILDIRAAFGPAAGLIAVRPRVG